jgi:phosphohistidine phosphatase
MKLYLVQHAEAQPKEIDPERHLTKKGIADARKMAAFLKPLKLSIGVIWHSGKTRSVDTAEILSGALTVKRGIKQHEGLGPDDSVKPVAEEIARLDDDVMIVGHQPFLSKLASVLITGQKDESVVSFTYAGVVCLQGIGSGRFTVRWMITPELLP